MGMPPPFTSYTHPAALVKGGGPSHSYPVPSCLLVTREQTAKKFAHLAQAANKFQIRKRKRSTPDKLSRSHLLAPHHKFTSARKPLHGPCYNLDHRGRRFRAPNSGGTRPWHLCGSAAWLKSTV